MTRGAAPRASFNPFPFMPPTPPDLSGDLLSAAATFALQTNLRSSSAIDAAVDCTVPGLLAGQVEGVVISGRDWASRKNLTCESLRFSVGTVAIDQGALITQQVVKLKSVPTGDAELVLSAEDFGNFLVHPLTRAATAANGPGGHDFEFDGGSGSSSNGKGRGVTLEDGAVCFGGVWAKNGGRYRVAMTPGEQERSVRVTTLEAPPGFGSGGRRRGEEGEGEGGVGGADDEDQQWDDDGGGDELAAAMAEFFGRLMIDLQGAQLTYRDMTVTKSKVRLSLSLRVVSFPPPNAQF